MWLSVRWRPWLSVVGTQVFNRTPGGSREGPIKYGLSAVLSFRLSDWFLGIGSLVFSKFQHGARNPYEVLRDRTRFIRKNLFAPKIWENGPIIGKKRVFWFYLKFPHFLLNLFINENWYYLLCFCTNFVFRKNFVPEIWGKIISSNQIARFLNQLYIQNKLLK